MVVNRDADSAFARLAAKTWLRVTDDHVVPDDLDEVVEPYFRIGMLVAFQLVGHASQNPDAPAAREVLDAIGVAFEILAAESEA